VTFEIEPGEDGGAHLRIVHAPRATAAIVPFPNRPGDRTTMAAGGAGFRKAA
jgi:hypothetical protein